MANVVLEGGGGDGWAVGLVGTAVKKSRMLPYFAVEPSLPAELRAALMTGTVAAVIAGVGSR